MFESKTKKSVENLNSSDFFFFFSTTGTHGKVGNTGKEIGPQNTLEDLRKFWNSRNTLELTKTSVFWNSRNTLELTKAREQPRLQESIDLLVIKNKLVFKNSRPESKF